MSSLNTYIDVVSRFDAKGLEEAEVKTAAMNARIKRMQATIGPAVNQKDDDRLIRNAIRNSDRLAREQEKVAQKTEDAANRAVRLGKAITVAHLAAKGLAVAAAGVDLKRAFDSGEIEKVTAATEKLKKAIEDLPVVGPAASSMSTIINDSGAFPFLKSLRDDVAKHFGKMTDDEVRAADENEAKEKAAFDKGKERQNRIAGFNAADEKIVEDLKLAAELEGKAPKQREAILARRKLAAFNAETLKRNEVTGDAFGTLRPERRAAREALGENVLAATFEADAERQEIEESAGRVVTIFFDKIDEEMEKQAESIEGSLDSFFGAVAEGSARDSRRADRIRSESTERYLASLGAPGQAAAFRIERQLREELEAAGENTELREALIGEAKSQLFALVPEAASATMAAVVNNPNLIDVRRGNADPYRETNDILRDLIGESLKRIDKNTANPPPARTS